MSGHPAILIADDDPSILSGFSKMISTLGYPCDVVSDSGEIIQKLNEKPYLILFLDLIMPDLDPKDVISYVRRNGLSTKVIMVSAQDDEGDIKSMLKAGAAAYLLKPVSFDVLKQAIRKIEEQNEVK